MTHEHRKVRIDSDHLIAELDQLKRMELDKRNQDFSSPAFHHLAEDVTRQAEQVWRTAHGEEDDGDDVPKADLTINDLGAEKAKP